MKKLRTLSGFVAFFAIPATLACLIYPFLEEAQSAAARRPMLQIDTEHLDIGEVWGYDTQTFTFPITNRSSRRILLAHVVQSASCNALGVPTNEALAPGETKNVAVSLNLNAVRDHDGRRPRQDIFFQLAAYESFGSKTVRAGTFQIIGIAQRPFSWEPRLLDLRGSLAIGGDPVVKTVNVSCHEPLSLTAEADTSILDVSVTSSGPLSHRLQITVLPKVEAESFETVVWLKATLANGDKLPRAPLSVVGTFAADVHALPSTVYLRTGGEGDLVPPAIVLQSRSGKAFTVDRVLYPSEVLQVVEQSRSNASSHVFHLQSSGTRSFDRLTAEEQEIAFVVTGTDSSTDTIRVRINGFASK